MIANSRSAGIGSAAVAVARCRTGSEYPIPMVTATGSVASNKSSQRSRLFVFVIVALGFMQLLALGFDWQSADSKRFFTYLAIVAITSFFQLNRTGGHGGFSMNLPFVLLSIVDLSLQEAVTIGCVAAVIQNLRSQEGWSLRRFLLSLGVQATLISTVCLVLKLMSFTVSLSK